MRARPIVTSNHAGNIRPFLLPAVRPVWRRIADVHGSVDLFADAQRMVREMAHWSDGLSDCFP
jgi:hypothetical protein